MYTIVKEQVKIWYSYKKLNGIFKKAMWKHLAYSLINLDESTDFDLLYEAAALLAGYGFMQEADILYETLLIHLPDEAQLKIDRAGTLLELGE